MLILVEYHWSYRILGTGKNCEAKNVVTTKWECIAAAKIFDQEFRKEIEDIDVDLGYPAGCFFSNGDQGFNFNRVIDPSKTTPSNLLPEINLAVCRS